MEKHSQNGFTLIELIVTMAVASILLGVGVPSFLEVMKNSRTSSQYNALVGSLYLARSETTKRGVDVTVCPRKEVGAMQCGTDWKNGWLVFVDNNPVLNTPDANIGAEDEVINVEEEVSGKNRIRAFGKANNGAAADTVNYIRYGSRGDTNWAGSTVEICDDEREEKHARAINIVLTGDIRRGRQLAKDEAPIDTFNNKVCQSAPT